VNCEKKMSDEQRIYEAILRLGCAQGSVNELAVVYTFPRIDVYGIIRALVQNGRIERTATGANKDRGTNCGVDSCPICSAPSCRECRKVLEVNQKKKILFPTQSTEKLKATDGQQNSSLLGAHLDRSDSLHDSLQKSPRQPLQELHRTGCVGRGVRIFRSCHPPKKGHDLARAGDETRVKAPVALPTCE
jgi:hypothetical protein